MLRIIDNLIPSSLWSLKATFGMVPEKLCVHNTANDAPAVNEARYVHNNPDATSYHYAVDDTQAVQILPLDRNGWHAGDGSYGPGNRKSVGIEICYSLSGGKRFERAQENAAELCVRLMHEFGWGLDLNRITKHEDYANKHCPHRTLDDYGWDYYLALVKDKYEELYPEDIPMTKEEKAQLDALKKTVDDLKKKNGELNENVTSLTKQNTQLENNIATINKKIAPCITSADWYAQITDAMGGKEATAMLVDLKKNGDFHGKDSSHFGLSEQMVRIMLIFYRMLKRLGLYK